jgi:hypothetical protein
MKRIARMIVGVGAALFLLVFTIPGTALADGCPETLVAKIFCPNRPGYYTYVCMDHHGFISVHTHCIRPE